MHVCVHVGGCFSRDSQQAGSSWFCRCCAIQVTDWWRDRPEEKLIHSFVTHWTKLGFHAAWLRPYKKRENQWGKRSAFVEHFCMRTPQLKNRFPRSHRGNVQRIMLLLLILQRGPDELNLLNNVNGISSVMESGVEIMEPKKVNQHSRFYMMTMWQQDAICNNALGALGSHSRAGAFQSGPHSQLAVRRHRTWDHCSWHPLRRHEQHGAGQEKKPGTLLTPKTSSSIQMQFVQHSDAVWRWSTLNRFERFPVFSVLRHISFIDLKA